MEINTVGDDVGPLEGMIIGYVNEDQNTFETCQRAHCLEMVFGITRWIPHLNDGWWLRDPESEEGELGCWLG